MQKNTQLIFLHSALGTCQDLTPLMDLFKDKGLSLHTFDFSGHGKTTAWPPEFRIDFFARELDGHIQKHKLTDVVCFGHSMGGYVALYHRANFENSPISRIFTYGTKFNWSPESVSKELPMLNPEHIQEKFPAFAETLQNKHGDRWKALLRSTAHMMQNLEKLDGLTREDILEVEIPVTLLLGDQDRMVTTEETQRMKGWLHHADVKTISHSKHEIERANLKEISQLVLEELIIN